MNRYLSATTMALLFSVTCNPSLAQLTAPPNHPSWPGGGYDPSKSTTPGSVPGRDIDGDSYADFKYAEASVGLSGCEAWCLTNKLGLAILVFICDKVIVHRCPYGRAFNRIQTEYTPPPPGGTTPGPKRIVCSVSLEGGLNNPPTWATPSAPIPPESQPSGGADADGDGLIEEVRNYPQYGPSGTIASIVTKKITRPPGGGTTPTVTTREYVPRPIPEQPPTTPEEPPSSSSVLTQDLVLVAIVLGVLFSVIGRLLVRRLNPHRPAFVAILLVVGCAAITVSCGSEENQRSTSGNGEVGSTLTMAGPPGFEPVSLRSEVAGSESPAVKSVALVITHNHGNPSPDPSVTTKGLEVRVRDNTNTIHSAVIWPWYDWVLKDANRYFMADLGSDLYVFRVGKKPDFSGGDFTYYFRLDATPGGSGAWVAANDASVQAADSTGAWRKQYASIEPDPSTVQWPAVASETIVVGPIEAGR